MPLHFKRGTKGNGLATKVPTSKLDILTQRAYWFLREHIGKPKAHSLLIEAQKIFDLDQRLLFLQAACERVHQQLQGKPEAGEQYLRDFAIFRHQPVGVREFICGEYFLNKANEIYPVVLEAVEELNNGRYVEAVMTGGIGSGKTTAALFTNAYQLYLLSCMRSPHKLFGLDPSSEIMLIFQSINRQLAKGVDYQRFRSMIEGSRYFKEHFPFNKDLEAKLVFPNRIEVVPVAGTETAAIGQNVIGGLIDELNYMAVVEKSKVAVDKGVWDQAISVYNSIARRRKSRFMESGRLPGILCLVSSKKYPGQFTDQKMAEAEKDPTIFVYDKRVWDIKPDSFGGRGWFPVFVGDLTRKPHVLDKEEEVTDEDRHLVVSVPEEFREDFNKDIINALREIAGISTLARHPFFLEVDKVNFAFREELPSIFSQSPVDFVDKRLTLIKKHFYKPELPRFAHCDLAISGDSAGLAIGTVTGFINITSEDKPAFMPVIRMDGVLEIRPPRNGEILFSKVREVIFSLIKMGLNIRWVTFDQFQSTDSQQILRQHGMITGQQSVDTVPCKPYDFCKTAVYEGRLEMPAHPHLQREIVMLEKDTKTGKVDHPPDGSKDCADALAAVVYGLTMRREIWGLYRIPLVMVPDAITSAPDKLEEKNAQKMQQEHRAYQGAEWDDPNRILRRRQEA